VLGEQQDAQAVSHAAALGQKTSPQRTQRTHKEDTKRRPCLSLCVFFVRS
jgi:hypothetical protein